MSRVPKRAFFYWDGGEMSWLRQRGIISFKNLNPDWQVDIIGPKDGIGVEANGYRGIVQRSDWSRWIELRDNGGVYFDTDIVFTRPVPDEWLDCDVGLITDGDNGGICSIGAAISSPHNEFFNFIVGACADRSKKKLIPNFQDYGVYVFSALAPVIKDRGLQSVAALVSTMDLKFCGLPIQSIQPVPWSSTSHLWSPVNLNLGNDTIGLHWYGGDALTKEFEHQVTETWCRENPCPVSSAVLAGLAIPV